MMAMIYCVLNELKTVFCAGSWAELKAGRKTRDVNETHLPQCAYKAIDSSFCIQGDNIPYMQKTGR